MRKLFQIMLAVAMVVLYLPLAEADNTAGLILKVTFDIPDKPLTIQTYPAGPFETVESKWVGFVVYACDPDSSSVAMEDITLPEGAMFGKAQVISKAASLGVRLESPPANPSGSSDFNVFLWQPDFGQGRVEPYIAIFRATNAENASVQLEVNIFVKEAVIAIKLNDGSWNLEGVKLGELRSNANAQGTPIHNVENIGNIPVMIAIRYGSDTVKTPSARPGLEQGKDTFITMVGNKVLPPNPRDPKDNRLDVPGGPLDVGEDRPLPLTFGAPTELSPWIKATFASYEVIAYPSDVMKIR